MDGRVVWANASARRLLDAEEVDGQLLCTLLEDEAISDQLDALRSEDGTREQTLPWPDGRHLRVTTYPVHEDVEAPRYVYTAVNLARQQEPAHREIGERMRALIDQPLVGFYIIQDGRFVYVNEMIEQLTGYSREELTAPSFQLIDLVVDDDREVVRENMRKRLAGQERAMRYRVRFQHKDGHLAYVEVHGIQSQYRGRAAISGVVVDLSNQQRTTANLKALLDSSPQGFVLLDRDLHV
ncbi:MAG: PAS domain S-box protein, partial [Coriobacteriia bacterium]|nr:PAS domain S-box protein [Coriobacteriia bacterium]